VVLASASPRRLELLAAVGVEVRRAPAAIDEAPGPHEHPRDLVVRLAGAKASAVAPDVPGALVIAADTVIAVGERILGKPVDEEHARRMLAELSGRRHEAWSGVCFFDPSRGFRRGGSFRSVVEMASLEPNEIERYVAGGEPLGKAGAYAIQGEGGRYARLVEGSFSNVVGLPVDELEPWWDAWRAAVDASEPAL